MTSSRAINMRLLQHKRKQLRNRKTATVTAAVTDVAIAKDKAIKEVNKKGTPSLEGIKSMLRKKGNNMKVGHFYFCDVCEKPIYSSNEGLVIHGNIYIADPTLRGGLIGNNFPDVKPGDKIEVTDVKETVLCRNCFSSIVFSNSPKDQKKWPKPKELQDFFWPTGEPMSQQEPQEPQEDLSWNTNGDTPF